MASLQGATFLGFLAFSDTLDQHDNLAPLEDLTSFYGTRETREGGVVKTRSPIRLLSESYDKDSAFILATEAGEDRDGGRIYLGCLPLSVKLLSGWWCLYCRAAEPSSGCGPQCFR